MSADRLGLDELMIVNPDAGGLSGMLLGGDGALYAVEAIGAGGEDAPDARFYLGDDGGLYQVADAGAGDLSGEALPSRFFLGDDGTLYQVTAEPRG